jgi:hypothetical protein
VSQKNVLHSEAFARNVSGGPVSSTPANCFTHTSQNSGGEEPPDAVSDCLPGVQNCVCVSVKVNRKHVCKDLQVEIKKSTMNMMQIQVVGM